MTSLEKINFHGWNNCYRLSNQALELIVTTDVGPRVSFLGLPGGVNMFAEYMDQHGKTGGAEWNIFGGHRLWHAPEGNPRSYYPDNTPIKSKEVKNGIRLTQPTEPTTGIQKEMTLVMDPEKARVRVAHKLINRGIWPVELAAWALSVMGQGGTGIVPFPPRGSHSEHLLPTNSLTMWAYTDMADPRWTWGKKYILLRQDPKAAYPQKIGAMVPDGWAAYANHGNLFIKKFSFVPGAAYPDFGCCVETFTNADMLELESLGPLTKLEPGASLDYVEDWFLVKDVPAPKNDADVDKNILPVVASL